MPAEAHLIPESEANCWSTSTAERLPGIYATEVLIIWNALDGNGLPLSGIYVLFQDQPEDNGIDC